MKLDLPAARTALENKESDSETGKLVINVVSKESFFLGDLPMTLEELRLRLSEQQLKSRIPLEVRIRTNRTVPYGAVEPILLVCTQVGLTHVSYSVVETE